MLIQKSFSIHRLQCYSNLILDTFSARIYVSPNFLNGSLIGFSLYLPKERFSLSGTETHFVFFAAVLHSVVGAEIQSQIWANVTAECHTWNCLRSKNALFRYVRKNNVLVMWFYGIELQTYHTCGSIFNWWSTTK